MSKRSWIEEQCFRMCSAEGVECICRKLNNEALERSLKDVRYSCQDDCKPEVSSIVNPNLDIDPTQIHDAIEEVVCEPTSKTEEET